MPDVDAKGVLAEIVRDDFLGGPDLRGERRYLCPDPDGGFVWGGRFRSIVKPMPEAELHAARLRDGAAAWAASKGNLAAPIFEIQAVETGRSGP